ncbi:MFS transporter [Marinobacter salinisoli]|uniref:MFS transporter n=1 Tax=Marinobacter salinisoli TaxID=2769486 RepID=A0ABX7MPR7_9GAMM|nr:MFS transporter [Marinobacter salinisoli]QSP94312.1 MFS transporter [Marinobacter salinisoli]
MDRPNSAYPLPMTLATLGALYLAQGLPSGLFAHALPVFWREAGVSLAWIGALKLLALPWVLKVLWAPKIDQSLQRGTAPAQWLTRLQLPAALLLFALGWIGLAPAGSTLFLVTALVLTINLLMATQDIVTDGLSVRWIPARWRGHANTVQVAGYKVGMLAGGALLLMLAQQLPHVAAIGIPATLLIVLYLLVRRYAPMRAPLSGQAIDPTHAHEVRQDNTQPFREGFVGFLHRPGMAFWIAILACYKIADAMGSGMIRPMLTDGGWTSADIGTFTLITTLAGLLGAVLGGWLYQRFGSRRSLIYAGLAQAATMAAWASVATAGADVARVYSIGLLEQLADGCSTVALFAVMMNLCRKDWAGTDFTLQASIQVITAGVFGAVGGVIAQFTGYATMLVLAGILGLAVLALFALKTRKQYRQLFDLHKDG